MRLRDLGGLIVVDFIDMEESKNRREVEQRLRDALRQDRARVQFSSISKFGLLELSRQRLRPALSEGSHITCPRCNGTGHIRDTESSALQILRIIQEESMKENTAAVHVQVPVEVTSFLLNEKRTEITKIELKQRVTVLLVPNKHLETPNYKLERLRHDDPRLENLQASYTMIEEPDDEVGITRREKAKAKQEPVIKGVLPDQPAPPAPPPRRWPHRRRPPWLLRPRWLPPPPRHPTPPVAASSPGCASCSAARRLRPRRPRWRHPWRPSAKAAAATRRVTEAAKVAATANPATVAAAVAGAIETIAVSAVAGAKAVRLTPPETVGKSRRGCPPGWPQRRPPRGPRRGPSRRTPRWTQRRRQPSWQRAGPSRSQMISKPPSRTSRHWMTLRSAPRGKPNARPWDVAEADAPAESLLPDGTPAPTKVNRASAAAAAAAVAAEVAATRPETASRAPKARPPRPQPTPRRMPSLPRHRLPRKSTRRLRATWPMPAAANGATAASGATATSVSKPSRRSRRPRWLPRSPRPPLSLLWRRRPLRHPHRFVSNPMCWRWMN
jgi:hypothetical protein